MEEIQQKQQVRKPQAEHLYRIPGDSLAISFFILEARSDDFSYS